MDVGNLAGSLISSNFCYIAEMIYPKQCKWYFITCVNLVMQCFLGHPRYEDIFFQFFNSQAHFLIWSRGFKNVFEKVITFDWNTEKYNSLCSSWFFWRALRELYIHSSESSHMVSLWMTLHTIHVWTAFLILDEPVHQWC